ncbi:MAG: sulfate transporter CysZ [Pseudomonadota bacterium]
MLSGVSAAARGARYYKRGVGLITQPGLRRFVALPLVANTVLFVLMVGWLKQQADAAMGWLTDSRWMQWLAGIDALAWLVTVVQGLLWLLFGVGVLIAVFYVFALVANVIAAPFNGLLAERVEAHLRGSALADAPVDWWAFTVSVPGTVLSELGKLLYLAVWLLPLLALTFIPGLNLFASIAWLGFSAWLVSLEYVDYPMANHGHRFKAVRQRLRRHRATALGFGGVATLAQTIPLVNLVAMPAAVAGATALWVEQLDTPADDRAPDLTESQP